MVHIDVSETGQAAENYSRAPWTSSELSSRNSSPMLGYSTHINWSQDRAKVAAREKLRVERSGVCQPAKGFPSLQQIEYSTVES